MSTRTEIAKAAAAGLRDYKASLGASPVVVGFDGFVDSIIKVVDKRHDLDSYDPIDTIAHLGEKISAAAGQSSNYELVTTLEKLGGNGPIMANALASIGFPVTYIGALGSPALHPVFEPFAEQAHVISISEPGYTDALEFDDGKLMFGKHGTLTGVNADRLKEVAGDRLNSVIGDSKMLAMVNWTMLNQMDSIWEYLISDVFPNLGERRWVFVDLADPEKRTAEDLKGALDRCSQFQEFADVICGYNLSEAVHVAEVLGITIDGEPEPQIEKIATDIREKLGVHTVVVHPRAGAAAACLTDDGVASGTFAGPLVAKPKLSTGAGDNFNAGFCLGRLAGLSIEQSLCAGTGTSGFYVRNAASPSLDELADFCDDLPAPE
jgi:sugar/nucleoside kinase (ribokinase family)